MFYSTYCPFGQIAIAQDVTVSTWRKKIHEKRARNSSVTSLVDNDNPNFPTPYPLLPAPLNTTSSSRPAFTDDKDEDAMFVTTDRPTDREAGINEHQSNGSGGGEEGKRNKGEEQREQTKTCFATRSPLVQRLISR